MAKQLGASSELFGNSINKNKEVKNNGSKEVEKEKGKEVIKLKRSYMLDESIIKKLERMKLDDFPTGTSLESIVEKAILFYYENNHKGQGD